MKKRPDETRWWVCVGGTERVQCVCVPPPPSLSLSTVKCTHTHHKMWAFSFVSRWIYFPSWALSTDMPMRHAVECDGYFVHIATAAPQ